MGVFGFQSVPKPGPTRAQNHLCASPSALRLAVNWRLCWSGHDDTGLSRRTCVPTNPRAQASTLESVPVGGLFFEWVLTCSRSARHDTDTLCAV